MNEQLGRHTIYPTSQQQSTSSQPVARTKRTASQRTHESSNEETTASPHRAGFTAGLHPECTPYTSSEQSTRPSSSRMTPRPAPVAVDEAETLDDEEDDALYAHHVPNVVRRYDRPVQQYHQQPHRNAAHGTRTMQAATPQTVVRVHRQPVPPRSHHMTDTQEQHHVPVQDAPTTRRTEPHTHPVQTRRRIHWLIYVGVIMLAIVGLYVGSSIVVKWWNLHQDDVTYGRPRAYQCDARVDHNDAHTPSHFLALNLHKQIEIIEFPGGDATKAQVYIGPTLIGDGQEFTSVTLSFRDVNGDGKPDMIVHIGDSQLVYINDNGTFRPAKASDHISM